MHVNRASAFVSPVTRLPLEIGKIHEEEYGEIKSGHLVAPGTDESYAIKNFIPRFVKEGGYADSFGKQWNRYRKVQIDKFNGLSNSRDRFYIGTEWSEDELKGQRILEVGSGAGRFTQIMLEAGAELYTCDFSSAVEANWANNGPHERLTIFQADIYNLPVPYNYFDKVFCYGVLQHTPDVKKAFMSLIPFFKSGGKIAIDVYSKPKIKWPSRFASKYLWRPITKRLPHKLLFNIVEWYVPRWVPIDNWSQKHMHWRLARLLEGLVPCINYSKAPWAKGFTEEQIIEWAVLDTFDALSPAYDYPQVIPTVQAWCEEAQLRNIKVARGAQGNIKANAEK